MRFFGSPAWVESSLAIPQSCCAEDSCTSSTRQVEQPFSSHCQAKRLLVVSALSRICQTTSTCSATSSLQQLLGTANPFKNSSCRFKGNSKTSRKVKRTSLKLTGTSQGMCLIQLGWSLGLSNQKQVEEHHQYWGKCNPQLSLSLALHLSLSGAHVSALT